MNTTLTLSYNGSFLSIKWMTTQTKEEEEEINHILGVYSNKVIK